MLVKLWVKNNILNIQSVKEDQCIVVRKWGVRAQSVLGDP